jgi:bifunctional DNA-binding transcriptional regulator/antitoxin component of YhaV-PrlF toxin-antitoxin module
MPVLSPKRQVTLPKDLCDRLSVEPGDDLLILEHEGRITILKRTPDASKGVMSQVKVNPKLSDAQSRDDAMATAGRGLAKSSRRRAAA